MSKYNYYRQYDIQETRCPLHLCPSYIEAYSHGLRRIYGKGITWHLMDFKKGIAGFIVKKKEHREVGRNIINRLNKNPHFVDKIIDNYSKQERKFLKLFLKIKRLDLAKLNLKELYKIYDSLDNAYRDFWDWALLIEPLDLVLLEEIKNQLDIKNEKSNYYLKILTTPSAGSFYQRQYRELLEIALKIKKDKKLFRLFNKLTPAKVITKIKTDYLWIWNKIRQHTAKYFWLEGSHYKVKPLIEVDFTKKIKEILKTKDIKKKIKILKNYVKNLKKEKRIILKKIKASPKLKFLSWIVDKIMFIHDRRKPIFLKYVYYVENLFKVIGQKQGYTVEEIKWLTPKEIRKLILGKKISHQTLKNRFQYSVLLSTIKGHKLYTSKKAHQIMNRYLPPISKLVKEITGDCACKGRVKGIVKVIASSKEFDKLKKGNILVTSMTRPDFVPIMKRAAAVITDEGGVTCHAAIVSRELSIPCVIGTKIATKVLKDRDKVEVDATKGIIRKIK